MLVVYFNVDGAHSYLTVRCSLCTYIIHRVSTIQLIDDCSEIRRRAYATFDSDPVLDHVGRYGNSNPFNVSQWSRIINETLDSNDEVTYICHSTHYVGTSGQNRLLTILANYS